MKPEMLLYRHLLCGALGGLDGMDERRMVAYLIGRVDVVSGGHDLRKMLGVTNEF